MTELMVKISLSRRMNTRNLNICSHTSVNPSIRLAPSSYFRHKQKLFIKRSMYRFANQQLELYDSSLLVKVCKYCLLPVAVATPQHTADIAAPGSCSSPHTGSPPGQFARPPSGQGSTDVQSGHEGPHITFCATWLHL